MHFLSVFFFPVKTLTMKKEEKWKAKKIKTEEDEG
jgi:hypothetical protein